MATTVWAAARRSWWNAVSMKRLVWLWSLNCLCKWRVQSGTGRVFPQRRCHANEGSSSTPSPLFPTDNPIQSLGEYDSLNDSGKARTLMTMSNFGDQLPRPRVLRTGADKKSNGTTPGPLDNLLMPLIDESVRRQYLIRDAELRQDYDVIRDLETRKSRRLAAKVMAEETKEFGDDDAASKWYNEADFYASLRADVTQDEGSHSRFMDQDEWYARDRQTQAKKVDKKKFGTLLDGIE